MSGELRFIQVKRVSIEQAAMLGRCLKIHPDHAMGLLVRFWFAAEKLPRCHTCHADVPGHVTDEDPAELISLVLGCDMDPKILFKGMVRSGFVDPISETCFRVRGTSIYAELEEKRVAARDRKRKERALKAAAKEQAGNRSRMSHGRPRDSHTDPEVFGSGLDTEKGTGSVSHSPVIDLFPSSPVQPVSRGNLSVRPAVAAKEVRVVELDQAEHVAGTAAGQRFDIPEDRTVEVSASFSLGYWQGLRSQFEDLEPDGTVHPERVIAKLEQSPFGLTGLTLVAMKVFLDEVKTSTKKKDLSTFCHLEVHEQRLKNARKWLARIGPIG